MAMAAAHAATIAGNSVRFTTCSLQCAAGVIGTRTQQAGRRTQDLSLGDRRIASWLAILTFAVYVYSFAGGGWNQNAQFDLTRAIVERHTFAIDAYAGNSGDVSYANGHVYANKAPALAWLAAIPYAVLAPLERARGIDLSAAHVLTFNAYLCTLLTVALPGALIPAMLYAAARRRRFAPRWSAFVALAVAFGTQLFPYATIFMVHVTSGALLLFALTSPRRGAAGFAAGLATAMNYLCAPALLLFALPGVVAPASGAPRRPGKAAATFLAGAAVPVALLLGYQRSCFAGFFTNSVVMTDARFLSSGALFGVLQAPSLPVFFAITFSPYRGVFYFAPLLIAALGGAILWLRGGGDRRELAAITALAAFFFAFNLCFNGWEGGFGIGGRYLVPVIPLAGLMILHCRGWLRPLTMALAALSFAINFTATVVDPQPSATIPRPLTQYLLPLLLRGHFSPDVPITPPWSAATFTGHTSVNRLTLDEAIVFERHPPGSPESEWTSFNLGEAFFGPGDARSITPLLLLLALGFAAIGFRARSMPRS
jgi:hypothetical protein